MDPLIKQDDAILARKLRIQEALRDIGRSSSWRALAEVIADLQAEATRALYTADGNDAWTIGRLQGECSTYDNILQHVNQSEQRLAEVKQAMQTQKLRNDAVDGLHREPPPGEDQ